MRAPALPATDLDLAGADFVDDPYPELSRLRKLGPVVRHEPTGLLLVTRHAAAGAVLRHRSLGRIWRDLEPEQMYGPFNTLHRNQMMEHEPPAHTRLRQLVAGAFARGHVERMWPRIKALADELLDDIANAASGSPVDVVAGYAEPLPVAVIADLLGIPAADRASLRDWSQAIVRMYELGRTPLVEAAAIAASTNFATYVRDLVAERRQRPSDDLLTDLVRGSDDGSQLSGEELVATVVLLLNAGHEASVNAFGNGLVDLLRHPQQLARVTSGAVPVAAAVEELLRHDAPLQLFERTATDDVEVGGVPVRRGAQVAVLLGSANRDDNVFANAHRFDVGRDPNPHLGFGMGVHFCLGAPLARMELAIALAALLARWPSLVLAGEPVRRPTFVLRGYARVDVSLEGPR
ncbi:cytochrome P450 [soil metagenome]